MYIVGFELKMITYVLLFLHFSTMVTIKTKLALLVDHLCLQVRIGVKEQYWVVIFVY